MKNVAIVGVGNISPAHIRGFLAHADDAKIVALCDIVPSKAEAKKAEYDLTDVDVYDSIQGILDRDDIDLVSVATPPSTHAELTIALLKSGKNVVVEKPMATSLEECDAMIQAAKESGQMLSVISQNRWRDDVTELKAVVDSGLLGPISSLQVDSAWWRGLPYYDLWWRGTWESEGGGPTLNHAIHHLDLVAWLMDGAPEAVTAVMTNAWHDNAEVEDLSVAILSYPRALATVTASVVHHGERQKFIIQGRDAAIELPWEVMADVTQPNGFPYETGDTERATAINAVRSAVEPLKHLNHGGQFGDILDALETGREPAVTGEQGKRTVETVQAIYRASIEKRTIPLPVSPDDEWYRGETLISRAPRFFQKTASVKEQAGDIRTHRGS
jgi:predicted dehydrogenase